ncbi:MAG: UDP-N-acetylglucosamine diphosphorylase/glucosamine-1-phosphate N-acetyltransferase [Elusimicrobia bacterium CG1_02_63_36]|nr:MAG: UDP-N-acetylglucosamine diphosphorylase/glucosamine-1-phosphate N-acetyltransferase [Elusimicrobia bacterium CG1_02_63_36]PIP82796.1 MAG: UDP-N-acetylglucosamine diphosphorylase/glucosamine-1-phosphate N-acetyltransferase [Elusimicrobia bacterium CG22_combo_CG10-13_8_21_14_all_63_91]PJA16103.1 MAG: UDP-N-acetylglucosamine diphosphorylase/glucosamine-1-phosphate N-acetyltransferase [Elusimicrobia bacterium CG_4_10_14_0_2_um_filter_63_34]PJB24690.1 MAG: UDP-N-acetylglucosamine diphosphoryl
MKSPTKKSVRPGSLGVLILAAGKGTRMRSELPKVLHPIGGRPMIYYLLRLANALKPEGIGLVVGHEIERVKKAVLDGVKDWGISRPVTFIHQKEQKGSGSAVLESMSFLKKHQTAIVTCGDSPLLTFDTMFSLLSGHRSEKHQVSLLTARFRDPKGYGRIVRSPMGEVLKIIEDSHCTPKEAAINEINSGTYCFEVELLTEAVKKLVPKGSKKEFYLTDCLEHIRSEGGRVTGFPSPSPEEALGVNTRIHLAQAERVLNRRALERLMLSGVSILDPNHTYVDVDVEIGQDSVIHPGTILRGKTKIGKGCEIGPFSVIQDSQIGNECSVINSYMEEARLHEKSSVGPFARLRPGTIAGPRARIGNFSEIKNSRIGYGSKVPHLSYVGDADIAEDVNIGAGTITCNYDGVKKNPTTIGAKAFIGSNVNLVAPVKIGRGATVGAGSTITEDVPDGNLAIARERQTNKVRK